MIQIECSVGGTVVPIFSFEVTGHAHGSTGSASANTTAKMLSLIGFDLAQVSIDASDPLPVTITTTDDSGASTQLFSGTYAVGKWNYNEDVVVMQFRDKAASLVDQKRVNTQGSDAGDQEPGESSSSNGISTQNNKLSGFVSNIASMMGLTANTNLTDDPLIGTLFGDSTDTIQLSSPQTLWGFLTKLARDTGNIVFANQQGQLYFGTEGQGPPLNLSWNIPIQDGSSYQPILKLDVEHNPARNSSHKTTVNSYNPTNGQVTKGTKTKKSGTAKYTFHTDGLTQAQAQKRAESISKDISRREVIVTCTLDYTPSVQIGQPAQLFGNVDPVFSGYQLYVSTFTHGFHMSHGHDSGEIYTTVTLLKQGDK